MLGLLVSFGVRLLDDNTIARQGLLIALCALPSFASGLLEDFTGIGWRYLRLLATFTSAVLAGILLDSWVTMLALPFLPTFVLPPLAALAFTCIAVSGITNAFNIIDGFNGLATGVASMILLALAYVAFKVGDTVVFSGAITAVGAIVGLMLWNFPKGLIHLGDGGAYLIGFWVAELSVILVTRNPEVSAWFPLLLCAYPIFETLFSIYRRTVLRGVHPMRADAAHLHHMIYKRLVRWAVGARTVTAANTRNSMTAPYLWLLTSAGAIPALLLWRHPSALQVCFLFFILVYTYSYSRIVRFRTPRWWIRRPSPETATKQGNHG
jgi:UDP-N-acetylmuramyl pentapeptide phosphotransferase/UDP-N-acetylglucosamine-1-phosphate transferase